MHPQDHIKQLIKRGVHAVIASHDKHFVFAYTIGLTEFNLPELIIFGPSPQNAHILLNTAAHIMREKGAYQDGDITDELANMVSAFKAVDLAVVAQFACQAWYFYEHKAKKPSFLQVVIPDRSGKLPWQRGFDSQYMNAAQPQLWKTLH